MDDNEVLAERARLGLLFVDYPEPVPTVGSEDGSSVRVTGAVVPVRVKAQCRLVPNNFRKSSGRAPFCQGAVAVKVKRLPSARRAFRIEE